MIMRIVVTGSSGFVGKHLVKELLNNNHEVTQISNTKLLNDQENYIQSDLAKEWPKIEGQVDAIIHLAGLAAVGASFNKPQKYIEVNSSIFTNMCEYYLYSKNQKPRIIAISSGAVYDHDSKLPLKENSPIKVSSPYVISKLLIENQAEYYRNRGLDCVVARPFNHIGPGQGEGFLVPDILKQLKTGNALNLGNVDTKADYTDVRDVVRAYRLMATTPTLRHFKYNVCSGYSTSGKQIIDKLCIILNKKDIIIKMDKSKIRPTDALEIYGDYSKLNQDTGWKPLYALSQTLLDIINL